MAHRKIIKTYVRGDIRAKSLLNKSLIAVLECQHVVDTTADAVRNYKDTKGLKCQVCTWIEEEAVAQAKVKPAPVKVEGNLEVLLNTMMEKINKLEAKQSKAAPARWRLADHEDAILKALETGPARASEVGEAIGIPASVTSGFLASLVDRGDVKKELAAGEKNRMGGPLYLYSLSTDYTG